ncbi:DUF2163 domain-containing protein [Undibacterium sp. SXout11W]|uniref:DUF2163 domain-containing protein n=1 Tax=Undibacterium sp. SXout11W TaxID=3413050 RepID=UPI003BF0208A
MKARTPALQAMLDSSIYYKCNLFTVTLITGQIYYWTDADIDVTCYGQVYSSSGPSISGAHFHLQRGLQVDTLTLNVLALPTDLLGGVTWDVAARSGALDGTVIKIDKAFLPAWGSPAESLNFFVGKVKSSQVGELLVTLTVVSDDDFLNTPVPKLTFQPGCVRDVYSPGCTLARAAYQKTGNVGAVVNRIKFASGLPDPNGWYALGSITFNSGQNSGVRRSIKSFVGGVVELSNPLVFDLATGDAFTIVAGCDKTPAACSAKNNLANYKGTPFVPKPETMV